MEDRRQLCWDIVVRAGEQRHKGLIVGMILADAQAAMYLRAGSATVESVTSPFKESKRLFDEYSFKFTTFLLESFRCLDESGEELVVQIVDVYRRGWRQAEGGGGGTSQGREW